MIFLLIITIIYSITGILFLTGLYRKKTLKNDKKQFVSLIIAVRNEEKYISDCLSDISKQTYPDNMFEVILVDDNSNDNTREIIKEFQKNMHNAKLLEIKENVKNFSPKKYALNEGIKNSIGEIILTTDADCRLKPKWIESMVTNFPEDSGMVAGFSQVCEKNKTNSIFTGIQALDFLSMMTASAGSISLGLPLAASGQNLAYRKEAFNKIGGFSKFKNRISGDDILLLQMIKKYTNFKINFSFNPESFVTTHPSKSLKDFFNQRIRWASNAFYQRKINIPFFIYLIDLYSVNIGLLIYLTLSILFKDFSFILLFCLLLKWLTDFFVLLKGAKIFDRIDLIKFFIFWEIFQPIYFTFAGIIGTFGKFTWKGRTYK
ncbi:glycosyltransferase [candidate division KSB1 bacterium]